MVAGVRERHVLRRRLELLEGRTVAACDDDSTLQRIRARLLGDQRAPIAHDSDLRSARRRDGEGRNHRGHAAALESHAKRKSVIGFGFDDFSRRGVYYVRAKRGEPTAYRSDLAKPESQGIDVVRTERAEQAAAFGLVRVPAKRAWLR